MSVMGKKSLDGVGGWSELYPSLFLNFFNFSKPLSCHTCMAFFFAILLGIILCVCLS